VTALGTNVLLMGIVGVWVGYAAFRLARRLLPRRLSSVGVASAVGAFVSVPAAAAAFTGLFAVGGQAPIPVGSVLTAMVSVHLLIGIGEALITALVVGSVVAVRPDLVHGARPLLEARELEIREGVRA
jgi:cobalt/nickel transport system permease protein